MQLIDTFRRYPGSCGVCHTPTPGPAAVDLEFDDIGSTIRQAHVYLCANCAYQVATLIVPVHGKAIVDADEASEVAGLRAELAAARAQLADHESIFASIRGTVPAGGDDA